MERYRSRRSLTCSGFFELLSSLWAKCGYTEPIIKWHPMEQWEQYPVVVYRLMERRPAEGIVERKPRHRETVVDPNNPGQYVLLMGQMFDYFVQFNVMAKSNDEADDLLDKFETFILTYTPFFKENGVNQIWFERQLSDDVITSWRDPVFVRSVIYRLRMEKIVPVVVGQLSQVNIDVNLFEEE